MKDVNEDILNGNLDEMDYLCALEDAYTHVKKQLYFKENQLVLRSKNYIGKIELKNEKIDELKEKASENNTFTIRFQRKTTELLGLRYSVTEKRQDCGTERQDI